MPSFVRHALEAAAAAAIGLALIAWLYALPTRDLSVPFEYLGDGMECALQAKMIIDRGWVTEHPGMGAPHGLTMHDYQRSAGVQYALLWLLARFSSDPFLVINLYFLATFPLAAAVALAVFRSLGLRLAAALPASLLYAFLAYHHYRGVGHLFLSGYYLVPAAALLASWAYLGEPLFGPGVTRRGWAALGLAALVGGAEVYYAFFGCFFLAVAGLVAAIRAGRWLAAGPAAALVATVVASVALNLAPALLYKLQHGPNPEAGVRLPWEVQSYDLRIIQMLAPATNHRVPAVASLKAAFNRQLLGGSENDFASLGLVASVGFLTLLVLLFARPGGGQPRDRHLEAFSTLNLAGLLLATSGGFSLVVAGAFPYVRCYNRICVFLAFFALFAVAHLTERALAGVRGRVATGAAYAVLAVLTVLGVLDQTPSTTAVANPDDAAALQRDKDFVRAVEGSLPEGAMIYQAPYATFPEGSVAGLALSLNGRTARWSQPSMRGRPSDLWARAAWRCGDEAMIDRLARAGFAGVCWDSRAGSPEDRAREAAARRLLGEPSVASPDGRYAFYPLAGYAERQRRGESAAESERRRLEALHPVLLRWDRGFQSGDGDAPRWGNARARAVLINTADRPQAVTLELSVASSPGGPGELRAHGLGADVTRAVTPTASRLSLDVVVPPGRSEVLFECTAPCHPNHGRRHFHARLLRVRTADGDARAGR